VRVALIGSWFADFIRASGRLSTASKGRIRDRTQPADHQKKPLPIAKRPYMELDTTKLSDLRASRVTMHVNKVHHVTTITRVAEDLGEDEDWLNHVANEMDAEDGVIWVYGVGEDGVMAFTDFGIENLIELIKLHKENTGLLTR
jgi:hypothetical protein